MNKKWLHLVFSLLLITTLQFTSCVKVFAENDSSTTTDYEWKDGPATVSLDDKATLKVAEDLMFLDADNTKRFMEDSESFPNGSEIGSLYGAGEQSNWYVIFEYNHTGHIDDSDKNDLNADELLKSYKRGTEEQNKKTVLRIS
ncbi:DUF2167 domain-containing protein [Paenibacillus barcinonensis]|nr:DUF2167 domain-containing protein [Paenibacillus barcinonensis]